MFERFTERARQVIVLAQEAARKCDHVYLGSEHILYGLCAEEEGLAARTLMGLGITEDVRRNLLPWAHDLTVTSTQVPFTPRAKKICELALREALSLGHNYIGTEHILLGLCRMAEQGENFRALELLKEQNITPQQIRQDVTRQLTLPPMRPVKMKQDPGKREAYFKLEESLKVTSVLSDDYIGKILAWVRAAESEAYARGRADAQRTEAS